MAALAGNVGELKGWGSFKKSIGLNKLHTRKTVKAAMAATKAVVMPSKKNAKQAGASLAKSPVASTVVRAAANFVAPGSGELIVGAAQGEAAKADAQAAEQQAQALTAKAVRAAREQEKAEAAAAEEQAADAGQDAPQGERKWPQYLLWGSVGLGSLALILKSRGKA